MKLTVKKFSGPRKLREWLTRNHDKAAEVWLVLCKGQASAGGLTYREALDEALCFGWIDGVRKSLDHDTYTVRFTPRKLSSYWSAVNLRRFDELRNQERVAAPGLAAFERRSRESGKYSFENRPSKLEPAMERRFRANQKAWEFFGSQAPWYQRTCIFWTMSAKKEETKGKRLGVLIEDSAKGQRLAALKRKEK